MAAQYLQQSAEIAMEDFVRGVWVSGKNLPLMRPLSQQILPGVACNLGMAVDRIFVGAGFVCYRSGGI